MAIGLVLLLLLLFLVLLFSFLSLLLYPFVTHFSFGLLHALGPGCCLSVRRCLIVLCIGISPHAVCLSAVLVQSVSMSFPQFARRTTCWEHGGTVYSKCDHSMYFLKYQSDMSSVFPSDCLSSSDDPSACHI